MSDVWHELKKFTQARIGLGRSGSALGTKDLLAFQLAHAQARDAVLRPWDLASLEKDLREMGQDFITVSTQASDRATYLQRPDLGRRLDPSSAEKFVGKYELTITVSDGLSANAIETHFFPLWKLLAPALQKAGLRCGPLVLAPFGRVALSDETGSQFGSKLSVIFIGERPGLSASDSLGIYLTYDPKPGNHDANRNCLSNIRPPGGMSYEQAVEKLLFLLRESLRLQLSGVQLKEDAALGGRDTKSIRS